MAKNAADRRELRARCTGDMNPFTSFHWSAKMVDLHSDPLTWKWNIGPGKTILLYELGFFHVHVSEWECTWIYTTLMDSLIRQVGCNSWRQVDSVIQADLLSRSNLGGPRLGQSNDSTPKKQVYQMCIV